MKFSEIVISYSFIKISSFLRTKTVPLQHLELTIYFSNSGSRKGAIIGAVEMPLIFQFFSEIVMVEYGDN